MIGRARELLAELVDVARAVRALPHVIETNRELELRVLRLKDDVGALAERINGLGAIVDELYLSPPADAEVPDA